MNNNYKDILLKVLEAIGYSDNKEVFIEDFVKNIDMQAVADLIESMPSDKQSEIKQKLIEAQNDQIKSSDLLKAYFTEGQMQEALKNSSKNMMEEWIKTITPTLSQAQKKNLSALFQQLSPTS